METTSQTRRRQLLRWAKPIFRLAILVLVGYGIWGTVVQAGEDLAARDFRLRDLRPGWLVLSSLIYLAALVPCWRFWHRILQVMGQQPHWRETMRAFYIGHLGKYVPGKAMVVVLRTALVRSPRVNTAIAASTVFVETLTMMAVGAFVAAGILGLLFREQRGLMLLALGLMVCAGLPTLPPIFRILVKRLGMGKVTGQVDLDAAVRGLTARVMVVGWLTIAVGWGLMGLSLWAVMRASGPELVSLWDWPLLTACVALALVAGFLSLLPGGIGVREAVVTALLAEPFGAGPAVIAAILLRLTWLGGELALSSLLYLGKPPEDDPEGQEERKIVTSEGNPGLPEQVSSVS